MSKMTDKEIIKALECCGHCECSNDKNKTECPLYYMSFCRNYLRKQSLDLINRQQAEIERLSEALEIHKGIAEDWKYEAKKLKEMVGEQE
jgi:hypothetical protein